MKQINNLVLRTLVAQLDDQKIDSNGLLNSVGLNLPTIFRDDFRLSANVFGQLLENMVQLTGDERLGFKMGFRTPLSILGSLGGLYQSCATLADMLTAMQRHIGWLDGINTYYWEKDSQQIHIITISDPDWQAAYPMAARQMIEHNIGFSLRHKREYLGHDVTPLALSLPYSKIGSVDLIETYFDCPVQFDYPYLQISLPSVLLSHRVASANERAFRVYELELAPFREESSTLYWQVKRVLELPKRLDNPTLESVSHQLSQSPRSLQRRLQREGLSFQAILTEVRLELANYYERTSPDMLKAELADRLGFSDSASLNRFLRNKKC
ncbi:AraC family transcriptional regulator ligand-binding domain-containing protein [Larkinella sp.]|uniref:AraC family transcriptional regulator ligand-binding domain-containing protein n=1 Tax=Larkinella sp. TaxID=2034517 RepID=UPI003BAAE481